MTRGEARLYVHTIDITHLQTFRDLIEQETDKAKHKPVSHYEALAIALRIEKDIIEHKYAQLFDSDSEDIRKILEELTIAPKRHLKFIEDHLDAIK
jgi:rubrerythrin